jgi:hypothetical protein
MLSFHDAAAIAAAPTIAAIDLNLRQLLADRVQHWTTTDLLNLTHLLIIEPGDSEEDIVEEVAFSPLVSSIDGERFGSDSFVPPFDWLSKVGGYFELIQTVGNDGFAFVLFIADAEGVASELRSLCRTYAEDPSCAGS